MSILPPDLFNDKNLAKIVSNVSNFGSFMSDVHMLSLLAPLEKIKDPYTMFKTLLDTKEFGTLCTSVSNKDSPEVLTMYVRSVITKWIDDLVGDILLNMFQDDHMNRILNNSNKNPELRFKMYIGKIAIKLLKSSKGSSFDLAPRDVQINYIKNIVTLLPTILDPELIKAVKTGPDVYDLIVDAVTESVMMFINKTCSWIKLDKHTDDNSVLNYYTDMINNLTNVLNYQSAHSKPKSNKRSRSRSRSRSEEPASKKPKI